MVSLLVATVCQRLINTLEIIAHDVILDVEVDLHALRHSPLVQDTSATSHTVRVQRHVANQTNTSVRRNVPDACGAVTAEKVAQVEQGLTLKVPILVVHAGVVGVLLGNVLTPDTIELGTDTDARSEPLTDSG